MDIAYIGIGKMGSNMIERLVVKGHTVIAYDPNQESRIHAEQVGARTVSSVTELMQNTASPRVIWLMIPHESIDEVLSVIHPFLEHHDTIIDGGNTPYLETIRRNKELEAEGVHYLDAGVSGGPSGARTGACIMVGGKKEVVHNHIKLFTDLSGEGGYAHVGESGTGHFVKMVHNGIEYGMMQALAEGFDIMRNAPFDHPLQLTKIASLYNHGSVIESRLVDWLLSGFEKYGENLDAVTGSAHASGEGHWTVETAKKLGVPVPVIEDSLKVRTETQSTPSYQGQLISVMRNQFGGHEIN